MIKALNIYKKYGQLNVLNGVSLDVKRGEIVSIVGSSGAGKTTFLQILGTLDKPDEGSLNINGIDINSLTQNKLAEFRNKNIGFIFQSHQLLPEFNALENICIPAFIQGTPRTEAEKKADELLLFLGIKKRKHHKPNELSGGEQQRISVARALINSPAIILADEPSGNLDSRNAQELHQLFFKLREELNQTFVIVTHNEDLANMADRKLTMKDGNILT